MNNDQLKVAIEALGWYRDEVAAIERNLIKKKTQAVTASMQVLGLDAGRRAENAIAALTVAQSTSKIYTYASTQATTCANCGKHKHTPLRIDAMGGYVCLTCIDQKLGSLLDEFGYPESAGKDEREVFEKWYGSTGGRRSPEEMMVEVFCWDAWQAGRASLPAPEREQQELGKDAEGGRGIDGPDYLRLSKSGYTLRVGWGDEKRIVAASPRQLHEMSAEAQRQWLEDADRLCDGWNRIENTKTGD